MDVYRISSALYIKDLTGLGPKTYGGRWNYRGVPAIYSSETRALAALEFLVHVKTRVADNLKIATISIPGSIVPLEFRIETLPKGWRDHPPPFKLAEMGTDWLKLLKSLLLRVPSAVIPNEFNIIINPMHKDMKYVKISHVADFTYDKRLHP
jgi:RES domain-containing protein